MVKVPVRVPLVEGAHDSVTVQVPCGAITLDVLHVPPVMVTPEPVVVMADGAAATYPVLVTVTARFELAFTAVVGNAPGVPEPNVNGPGLPATNEMTLP
jgi:hypothetical protein